MRKQRGDTIVEVLMAMAVVGLVLGVAYGIANRSVQVGRSAQERSEALKLAESQIELMKQYVERDTTTETPMDVLGDSLALNGSEEGACFTAEVDGTISVSKVDADSLDTKGDACESGLYQVYITCTSEKPSENASPVAKAKTCKNAGGGANRVILVRIIWDRLGGGLRADGTPVRDNLDLYYRYGE